MRMPRAGRVGFLLCVMSVAVHADPLPPGDALAKAKTDAERAAWLDAHASEVTPALAAQLLDRAKPLAGSDAPAALALLQASLMVAERTQDRAAQARALFTIGQVHNARDEF